MRANPMIRGMRGNMALISLLSENCLRFPRRRTDATIFKDLKTQRTTRYPCLPSYSPKIPHYLPHISTSKSGKTHITFPTSWRCLRTRISDSVSLRAILEVKAKENITCSPADPAASFFIGNRASNSRSLALEIQRDINK